MKSDGQQYLCCAECGAFVNSSEAEAHQCPKFMETGAALARVHEMAKVYAKEHEQDMSHNEKLALDTVEDLIVNNFEEYGNEHKDHPGKS